MTRRRKLVLAVATLTVAVVVLAGAYATRDDDFAAKYRAIDNATTGQQAQAMFGPSNLLHYSLVGDTLAETYSWKSEDKSRTVKMTFYLGRAIDKQMVAKDGTFLSSEDLLSEEGWLARVWKRVRRYSW